MEKQLAFHRKYRAKDLSEMVGNEDIKKSLKTIQGLQKKPQLILLKGHAGCGKTTTARMLGKIYLCERNNEMFEEGGAVEYEHNSLTCNECESCKTFNEYILGGNADDLPELKEYNSSKIKKENIAEIEAYMTAPISFSSWRVMIFDECHLLTQAVMGDLLKLFEEPPENVLIILCTTNPEKLLPTIRSRCQYILTVQKPKEAEMLNLLKSVCIKEDILYDNKGLHLIAVKGNYTPRDCLILLENVRNEKGGADYSSVAAVINEVQDKYYFAFFDYLNNMNTLRYMVLLGEVKQIYSITDFVRGLAQFVSRSLYIYYGVLTEGVDESEFGAIKKLYQKYSPEDLSYIMHLILHIQSVSEEDKELELQKLAYDGLKPAWYLKGGATVQGEVTHEEKIADLKAGISAEANQSSINKIARITNTDEEQAKALKFNETLDMASLLKDSKKVISDTSVFD